MATEVGDCLELLDPRLDRRHRSYRSAVLGQDLSVLRLRVPLELLRLDERWLPRYAFIDTYFLAIGNNQY